MQILRIVQNKMKLKNRSYLSLVAKSLGSFTALLRKKHHPITRPQYRVKYCILAISNCLFKHAKRRFHCVLVGPVRVPSLWSYQGLHQAIQPHLQAGLLSEIQGTWLRQVTRQREHGSDR
jgi:hypothetical protein